MYFDKRTLHGTSSSQGKNGSIEFKLHQVYAQNRHTRADGISFTLG